MLTCIHQHRGQRANKIYVCTKHSSDGRMIEGFWMNYEIGIADANYALYLLEFTLNSSEGVEYYIVYDKEGVALRDYDATQKPKRN